MYVVSDQCVQTPVLSPRPLCIQLLDVYLHRANPEQVEHFLKTQCFHLLANQLHQHEATTELAEACLTIVFGRPFSLSDRFVVFWCLLHDGEVPCMGIVLKCGDSSFELLSSCC